MTCKIPGLLIALAVAGALSMPVPAHAQQARDADEFLIVDCLLPGKIKKLGRKLTFLTPRRPARATQRDCEIRGGEYVAYDRADYATALRIWLPQAQEGDPKAQTYVGEMAEKGLGQTPDYEMAALWYRRAAEQGHAPAQVNLGQLYEKGLGVERNKQTAILWYRRAAGLGDAQLAGIAFGDSAAEINRLQTALDERSQEVDALQRDLETLADELTRARGERRKVDAEIADQRRALEQRRKSLEAEKAALAAAQKQAAIDPAEERARLSGQARDLAARESELERRQAAFEKRQAESEKALAEARNRRTEDVVKEEAILRRQRDELAGLNLELESKEQELAAQRENMSASVEELDRRARQLALEKARLRERSELMDEQAASLNEKRASIEEDRKRAELALAADRTQLNRRFAQERRLLREQVDRLAEREAALARKEQEMTETQEAAKQAMMADRKAMMADLRQRAEGIAEREREVAQLETLYAKRERELGAMNKLIGKLDTQIEQRRLQMASLSGAGGDPSSAGSGVEPRIEIIEPRLRKVRGDSIAFTRLDTPARTIVGRVVAPNGIYQLFVNDDEVTLDRNSLFQVKVPLAQGATPVRIVALDTAGLRTELAFELQREKTGRIAATAPANASEVDRGVPNVDFGKFYALIVGNDDYRDLPKLNTPHNDATDLAAVLERKYGFKTTVLLDATRYEILSALNKLRAELTENDNLLVYYAGHGVLDTVNQRGHWLPVDAQSGNTANWISNVAITDILNAMSARKVLVIADSCYSGALTRSTLARLDAGRSAAAWKSWLELMAAKKSRTALTSGGLAPVLDGGGGRHSIFAKALIDALNDNKGVVDGRTLHQIVAQGVSYSAAGANFEQLPRYAPIKFAGHEAGDFFFVPRTQG